MIHLDHPPEDCTAFFRDALQLLHTSNSQFMVGGALAMFYYTGITRPTKDIDVFLSNREHRKVAAAFHGHAHAGKFKAVSPSRYPHL